MAKRRQAVRGKEVDRRKKHVALKKISALLLLLWKPKPITILIVIGMLVFSYRSIEIKQVLPIESVQIEGEFNYLNKEQLRKQALPVVEGGFFTVDLTAVRQVLMSMPWVEDVSVRRQWPNRLLVRVIEKQPIVYWNDKALLSAKGKLFLPQDKLEIKLPSLTGPEGQHQSMLKEFARMQAWLLETNLHIQHMKQDERRSWTLKMTTGLELRLGRTSLHERLHRFVSVYKSDLQTKSEQLRHIDMRYTNGFAVAWKEA